MERDLLCFNTIFYMMWHGLVVIRTILDSFPFCLNVSCFFDEHVRSNILTAKSFTFGWIYQSSDFYFRILGPSKSQNCNYCFFLVNVGISFPG